MKIYKTYFDKTVWKRLPYAVFLGHKVVKVKLFGLFTVSERRK